MGQWLGTSDPTDDAEYAAEGWRDRAPTPTYALGRFFQSQLGDSGLGAQLARGLRRDFLDPVRPWWIDRKSDREEAARLNERYGIEGRLSFKHAMSERAARELHGVRQREIAAEDAMRRAGFGFGATLGVSLAAGLADPANIALSFTPIPWMARAHALEQGLSGAARLGARVGLGAAEGAIGGALIEPLVYGINRAEGNDYTFADSLMNVFVSAGAGAVFRPLFLGLTERGGTVGQGVPPEPAFGADGLDLIDLATVAPERLPADFAARVQEVPEAPAFDPLPARAAVASVETRATAMAEAIEAVAEGRAIDVVATFDRAEREGLQALARHAETRRVPFRSLKDAEAVAPDNSTLPVRYALMELDDIVASHTPDGMANPDYPEALQPRDRGKITSRLQVADMAAKLNPGRLGETFDAQTGAPIVGDDGLVESGNGRVLALQRALVENGPPAKAYRDWLVAQGYPVAGMTEPVLVRVADAGRDPETRIAFAKAANARQTAAQDPVEIARLDAARLSLDDLALHKGGAVTSVENSAFARAALGKVASAEDLGELIDAQTGRLSQKGEARLSAAVVQMAYGDAGIVRDLFEATDANLRGLGLALAEAAPGWARMRAAVRAGEIVASVDATLHLTAAADIARRARAAGLSVAKIVETRDMFDELSPVTLDFLRSFFGDDMKRQISASRIRAALDKYVEQAMLASAEPGLFGDVANVTSADLSRLARGAADAVADEGVAPAPGDAPAAGRDDAVVGRERGDVGGGGGVSQAGGGDPVRLIEEPKAAAPGPRPEARATGVARTLAGHSDPELTRLQAEADAIDGLIEGIEAQGLLEPETVEALRAAGGDPARRDLEADALRAAALCLMQTGKGGS
jgi:hypothetical protein